ncbi:MAG TPA: prepilin peptidase [Elusimicrobiales bacterium]|nr:prepilin peptidase [Elusimicrobiales bacterium]
MIYIAFAFVMGLAVGSFLNVCISRLPKDESIVFPTSHCPLCRAPIKFYDNIPLISFAVLRGRCRACRAPISVKYPVVELAAGVLTALFAARWGGNLPWLAVSLAAVYALLVVSVIDFETMMISDFFSLLLAVLGLAGSSFNPCFEGGWAARLGQSAGGAAAGAGVIWLLALMGKVLYKKEAVGAGDIFLMGGIGALCGWQGVLSTVIMASFFGSVYGVSLLLLKRADRMSHMPFGPFLAAGAAINLYSLVKPEYFLISLPL